MSASHDHRLEEAAFADMTPQEFPLAVAFHIAHGTAKHAEIREATCLAIFGFMLADDMPGLVGFFNQMNAVLDMRPSAPVAEVIRTTNGIGDEMLLLLDEDGQLIYMDGKPAAYSGTVIRWIAEWSMGNEQQTIQ